MSDLDDFVTNKQFIYDNCVIREHADSDVSDGSLFSWRKSIESETSSFSELETSEDSSDEDITLKVSVKESFILMLGFLNKIKKYFDENPESAAKTLNEELLLLETVLINSAESFGYNVQSTRPNGSAKEKEAKTTKQNGKNTSSEQTQLAKMSGQAEIHSGPNKKPNNAESFGCNVKNTPLNGHVEENKAKTTKQNRKNTPSKQTQFVKMNGDAEIHSEPDKEPRRKSIRIRNLAKNDKNEDTAVEKRQQKRQSKKRKIEDVDEEDRRVSKRVKHNVSNDRLSCTVAKLKQVTEEIKKKALSPVKEVREMRNSNSEDSQQSSDSPSKEKDTKLLRNTSTRSGRKKLYSLESWLDTLSDMMS